ncbi:hypothetical protein LCGC14_1676020 [marine sediment metagenome]|uniref:Uncharacterized protein n=1 Tax=marine sediment metagenome TaxID=412755 RepID=A0A0F9HQP1_9ZZZZ
MIKTHGKIVTSHNGTRHRMMTPRQAYVVACSLYRQERSFRGAHLILIGEPRWLMQRQYESICAEIRSFSNTDVLIAAYDSLGAWSPDILAAYL